ncbi:unnamed protein product, partial [Scytosiphon promiscuus]
SPSSPRGYCCRVTSTDGKVVEADAVVVTLPLGVLKARVVDFVPSLPERKAQAISALGYGCLNKVVLEFPKAFWLLKMGSRRLLAHVSETPGDFYLFLDLTNMCGRPVLVALIPGEQAHRAERESAGETAGRCLTVLRRVFPEVTVPAPLHAAASRWGSDKWSRGSYSFVRVGSSSEDMRALGTPVGQNLHFAGEATSMKYPATVHGAWLSGIREAKSIYYELNPDAKRPRVRGPGKKTKRAAAAKANSSQDKAAASNGAAGAGPTTPSDGSAGGGGGGSGSGGGVVSEGG